MSAYYVNTVRVYCSNLSLLAARLTFRISLSFQGDEAYLVSTCPNFSTTTLQGCPRGRGSFCHFDPPPHDSRIVAPTSARPLPQSSMTARLPAGQCDSNSDSNVCGATVHFFELLPDLVVSEHGKSEREIRYVLAVSTILIQQGRKKLRIQVGRQQIQQLPRLVYLSLSKSGNINKNSISNVEGVVNEQDTHHQH